MIRRVDVPSLDFQPTVPVFVRRLAAQHPELDFVVELERRMTYAQAERWSAALARTLLARGAGKGTRVAFMFGNGAEWVVTFLAVMRIGGVAMPLSTLFRPAELRTALRLGDVDTLIVPADLMGKDHVAFLEEALPSVAGASGALRLPDAPFLRSILVSGSFDRSWGTPTVIVPDDSSAAVAAEGDSADGISEEFLAMVEDEVHPGDPGMVIFTSGATAQPKGVMHTHGCWIRHTANVADTTETPWDQRSLAGLPFFWVGGIALSVGITMHRRSTVLCTGKFDAEASLELVAREHATAITLMPGLYSRLRAAADAAGATLPVPPPPPGPRVGQQLGMTETMAAYIVSGGHGQEIPEGHPAHGFKVPHMQYRIADLDTGETLPDGQEGEICVRGYSLTIGMCKRERHEVFDDDGWYHTGDKGILDGDMIIFTGRAKDLIKSAGANVAPREVEVLLDADPSVLLSLVVGVPDPAREEIVGAVIVPVAGQVVDAAALVARAARDLSPYKVPRRVLVLPETELPYLATGKPDRAAVRDLLITQGTDV